MNYASSATHPFVPAVGSSLPQDDIARLLLRVTLGLLILLHGIAKLRGGLDFVVHSVGQAGLLPALAYLVYAGEIVAPLLLIAGWWTRPAALVVAVNMAMAVLLVHLGQLATLAPTGGWALELQAMYLAMALAVALLGAGRFSLGAAHSRWN
jgi:putative oxidoreductase